MTELHSVVAGTGSYLPQRVVTNDELSATLDTSHEWIFSRTGIAERRIAAENETTADLAEHAARNAMDSAGIKTSDIDLIVVATTTPDHVFPSVASMIQYRLGVAGFPAFDIQAVCAGFVYALDIVDRYIRTGGARCALVIGAETFSRIIDWTDRGTCVLFGDGAGAMIVRAGSQPGIRSTHLYADGRYKELLWVPVGVSTAHDELEAGRAFTRMKGNEVFRVAVNQLGEVAEQALRANHLSVDQVDWLVPHQANVRIIKATAKKLGLPMEKVVLTIDRHGNTSAASIPLAFDEAVRDGRIKRGHNVIIEGFGGGFVWGSALITY